VLMSYVFFIIQRTIILDNQTAIAVWVVSYWFDGRSIDIVRSQPKDVDVALQFTIFGGPIFCRFINVTDSLIVARVPQNSLATWPGIPSPPNTPQPRGAQSPFVTNSYFKLRAACSVKIRIPAQSSLFCEDN
jgi:hypothetical protein